MARKKSGEMDGRRRARLHNELAKYSPEDAFSYSAAVILNAGPKYWTADPDGRAMALLAQAKADEAARRATRTPTPEARYRREETGEDERMALIRELESAYPTNAYAVRTGEMDPAYAQRLMGVTQKYGLTSPVDEELTYLRDLLRRGLELSTLLQRGNKMGTRKRGEGGGRNER